MTERDNRCDGRRSPTSSGEAGGAGTEVSFFPRDVRSTITHLRANLHRAVPMAELAAQAGVSERSLRDHFQKFLGTSPTAYGLRLRLNAARHQLRQQG